MDGHGPPKLVHKIGFGYKLDYMPAPLIIGYHQFSKRVEQAGFNIRVLLVPLNDLSSDLDLVFVPREFESDAAAMLPAEKIIALDEFVNQPLYADLVRRLEEGIEISAERLDPNSTKSDEGMIVRYRGYDRID